MSFEWGGGEEDGTTPEIESRVNGGSHGWANLPVHGNLGSETSSSSSSLLSSLIGGHFSRRKPPSHFFDRECAFDLGYSENSHFGGAMKYVLAPERISVYVWGKVCYGNEKWAIYINPYPRVIFLTFFPRLMKISTCKNVSDVSWKGIHFLQ